MTCVKMFQSSRPMKSLRSMSPNSSTELSLLLCLMIIMESQTTRDGIHFVSLASLWMSYFNNGCEKLSRNLSFNNFSDTDFKTQTTYWEHFIEHFSRWYFYPYKEAIFSHVSLLAFVPLSEITKNESNPMPLSCIKGFQIFQMAVFSSTCLPPSSKHFLEFTYFKRTRCIRKYSKKGKKRQIKLLIIIFFFPFWIRSLLRNYVTGLHIKGNWSHNHGTARYWIKGSSQNPSQETVPERKISQQIITKDYIPDLAWSPCFIYEDTMSQGGWI